LPQCFQTALDYPQVHSSHLVQADPLVRQLQRAQEVLAPLQNLVYQSPLVQEVLSIQMVQHFQMDLVVLLVQKLQHYQETPEHLRAQVDLVDQMHQMVQVDLLDLHFL